MKTCSVRKKEREEDVVPGKLFPGVLDIFACPHFSTGHEINLATSFEDTEGTERGAAYTIHQATNTRLTIGIFWFMIDS